LKDYPEGVALAKIFEEMTTSSGIDAADKIALNNFGKYITAILPTAELLNNNLENLLKTIKDEDFKKLSESTTGVSYDTLSSAVNNHNAQSIVRCMKAAVEKIKAKEKIQ
jgi:hypothetical protein